MEALAMKFAGKVEFLIVYCQEAHPESVPATKTWDARAKRAGELAEKKNSTRRVLIDGFGKENTHAKYGGHPAMTTEVFLIDQEGKIAYQQQFADAESLGERLEAMVGEAVP